MPNDDMIIPKILPPSEDGVFKSLLTNPDAKDVLRDVAGSFLHMPIESVEVRNVEMPITDIREKRERFDVNCALSGGSQLNLEMQSESMSGDNALTGYRAIKSRAVYNLCSLHAGQAGRKVRYDELLRSYQMTFCGYTVFPGRKGFVSRYSFRDEEGAELADAVGIIFVELTKVRDVAKKPVQSMTGEEAWGLFFAYASRQKYRGLIGELAAARREIKMAMEQLQAISKDEIERAHFRSRRMYQMDMDHNLIAAKDEGIAQGRVEGRVEGRAEGKAEGRAEGKAEGANQLAELIKKGYDIDEALKMMEENKPLMK